MSEKINNNTHEEPIVGTIINDTDNKEDSKMESRKERRIKAEQKARRWKAFWIIVGLLLLGHIIWCLAKHVYAPDSCHICGKPEQACTCQSTIQKQVNRIAELEAAASTGNAVQYCSVCNQKESACTCASLIASLRANQSSNGNGTCKQCPVHCECEHADVHVDTYMTQALIRTATECRVNTITMRYTCLTCGEWMESAVESVVDYEHNYGKDNICDDCGFPKPATTPTVKPNVPTAKPTQKPTTTPPAACNHPHTYDKEGNTTWKKVGTESCCGENVQTIIKVCSSCGVEVSRDTQVIGTTAHEFDRRTCVKCGYKKPAQQGFGKDEGTIEPPQNEWTYDDDGEAANPVG